MAATTGSLRDCCHVLCVGFAVVLFDDAVVLAHHHPHVSAMQSLTRLPYLFGVAVYAFEVRSSS